MLTGNSNTYEERTRNKESKKRREESRKYSLFLTTVAAQHQITIEMFHKTAYLPSTGNCAPNEDEFLAGYKYKEQGGSGSKSEWDPSPLLTPNHPLPENQNPSPSVPKIQKSTSNAKAEEEISPTALEGLALLLTSADEPSEYGHHGNGEEELAVELEKYMCILHDAADENWDREREKYVYVLMGALLEGHGTEDEGVRIDSIGMRGGDILR